MDYASRTPDGEINIFALEAFAMKQKKSHMRPMGDEERARLVGPTEAFRRRNFPPIDWHDLVDHLYQRDSPPTIDRSKLPRRPAPSPKWSIYNR